MYVQKQTDKTANRTLNIKICDFELCLTCLFIFKNKFRDEKQKNCFNQKMKSK